MKIWMPVLGFGSTGGYRVLSKLADSWIDLGHEVEFLTHRGSAKPYFPTRAQICSTDVLGRPAATAENGPKTHPLLMMLGLALALRKRAKSGDIVLANHCLTAFPVAYSGVHEARNCYYVQAYEPEYYSLQRGLAARVIEWLARRSYRLDLLQIANSPIYLGYREIVAKAWVPPGIDLGTFDARPRNRGKPATSSVIIGCVGRKEPQKGTKYVIEAFEQLHERDPRFTLTVAFGNLPEGWSHPAATVVHPRSDAELADFYRSVDIVVSPGTVQFGAFHYPVLESLACGTPVVHTGYAPGTPENSWIVQPFSAEAIVAAVLQIVSTDCTAKIAAGIRDAKQYSWDAVANQMLGLMADARS